MFIPFWFGQTYKGLKEKYIYIYDASEIYPTHTPPFYLTATTVHPPLFSWLLSGNILCIVEYNSMNL